MDAKPLPITWDVGRTLEMATGPRDILSVTLRSHFDDSYHIRNLVVELGDFRLVPKPVQTQIGHGGC